MGRRWWLGAVLLCCAQMAWATKAEPAAPKTGDVPPALLGKTKDGDVVDLAGLRGKIVIVTFWASWCGYCLKELPVLNALQTQIGDQWLKIVAVNVQDSTADYRSMTRQMRDFELALTRDPSGAIAEGYGVKSYPNLWMIDPQGRIASHHVGYGEDSLQSIVDEIKRLLEIELQRQQTPRAALVAPNVLAE